MSERAPFVVLEGLEGAGKSVQIARLAQALEEHGVPCVTTREPGGTELSEAIREILLDRPELQLDGRTELLLFSAARRAHVEEVIRPALEAGAVVLCDRFELSTRAYQGYGRGVPQESVRAVTAEATSGLLPDVYLVLDVPASVGRDRQRGADLFPDRIEREQSAFMERVERGYRELAAEDPERCVLLDGRGSPDEVQRRARDVLQGRFPAWFPEVK